MRKRVWHRGPSEGRWRRQELLLLLLLATRGGVGSPIDGMGAELGAWGRLVLSTAGGCVQMVRRGV